MDESNVVEFLDLRSGVTSTTLPHEQDLHNQPNPAFSPNSIATAAGVREMDLDHDARCMYTTCVLYSVCALLGDYTTIDH